MRSRTWRQQESCGKGASQPSYRSPFAWKRVRAGHTYRDCGKAAGYPLVADNSGSHGEQEGVATSGQGHPDLPDDLLSFHHDPLACAVAAAWGGTQVEELELAGPPRR